MRRANTGTGYRDTGHRDTRPADTRPRLRSPAVRRTAVAALLTGGVAVAGAAGVQAAPAAASVADGPPATPGPATAAATAPPAVQATAPAPPVGPVLGPGSAGPAVADWQRSLNGWLAGYGQPPIAVDGLFGPATEAATRNLQQSAGLPVDGTVTPATRALLAQATTPPDARPVLRPGSLGVAVSSWQGDINSWRGAGPPLPVDGVFGPVTARATQAFQQWAGLTPDGVVGPATYAAMDRALVATPTNATAYADDLVRAWGAGDRDRAGRYATAQAFQTLFAHADPGGPGWDRTGADGAAGTDHVTYRNATTGEVLSVEVDNIAVGNGQAHAIRQAVFT